jgi:hypothetical protein
MRRHEPDSESLTIDRAAAAELPATEAVREWASSKRAFISSVMSEFKDERRAAAAAIRSTGAAPVMFETFGGRDADPEDAYLGEVESADIYIGILGRRYGKPLPSRFSATHTEYLHAEQHGLRLAAWCSDSADREGHEQSFLDEIRTFHVVPTFTSASDLQAQIEGRLKAIAAEDLSPWCKLGSIVFRASAVVDHGDELEVTARIRSDAVAHALEALRGDKFGGHQDLQFTWAGRSKTMRVTSINSTTTTARSKTLHVRLERRDPSRDYILDMSIGDLTPADLTEVAVRTALFGERSRLTKHHMEFLTELPDPFDALRRARVADEVVRPLAEVMLVEALVGSGRASRLFDIRLGSAVRGVRHLQLSWEAPQRYSNERAVTKTVKGDVRL